MPKRVKLTQDAIFTQMKRRRGYTRLSRKNQVTIPKTVIEQVGAQPGDAFEVKAGRDGAIVLRREKSLAQQRREAIEKYAGALTGVYSPNYLEDLRNEWER
jgi:AbrB family looped-hinge helix DNA binding protein